MEKKLSEKLSALEDLLPRRSLPFNSCQVVIFRKLKLHATLVIPIT